MRLLEHARAPYIYRCFAHACTPPPPSQLSVTWPRYIRRPLCLHLAVKSLQPLAQGSNNVVRICAHVVRFQRPELAPEHALRLCEDLNLALPLDDDDDTRNSNTGRVRQQHEHNTYVGRCMLGSSHCRRTKRSNRIEQSRCTLDNPHLHQD